MFDKKSIKREIDKLPDDVLGEVLDFIQFLKTKRETGLLTRSFQELSESSFQRIWDNEEDAAYDTVQ